MSIRIPLRLIQAQLNPRSHSSSKAPLQLARQITAASASMAIQRTIALDARETEVRDFLVNAANLYAKANGGQVPVLRFAGGWVRDKLLGGESKDIDVAIDCMSGKDFYQALQQYEQTQGSDGDASGDGGTGAKILGRLGEIKKDAEKSKHLETATTRLFGLEVDLVNLRTETYNEDSRNPIMEMGTAEEDAARRDATINAMFYNLNTKEVEDLTGRGLDDLEAKVIRTPLDPEQTFRDDPLRILRLIRFACRFGFEIEAQALHWMKDKSIQATLEKKISRERILVELEKTLKGPDPVRALRIILEQDLYNTIFTIPDYPDGVVPRVDPERLSLALAPSTTTASEPRTAQILTLLSLTSTEDRWRIWLLAAILPWFEHQVPPAVAKKGAPPTMAARVARDSLKIDNSTLKAMSAAETHVAAARELAAGQQAAKAGADENSDGARKRQRVAYDRVAVGMNIRRWGENWRCVVAAAAMMDITAGADVDVAGVLDGYKGFVEFIEREELAEVWNAKVFKPVLDGKEVFEAVKKYRSNVTKGKWMTQATEVVAEYQLAEGENASAEGAEKQLIQSANDGKLDLAPPKSSSRK